jgi:DinB superfamily
MATKRKKKPSKKQTAPKRGNHEKALREQLKELLMWEGAHVNWKSALAGLPAEKRGAKAAGLPHTPWELLEHARITQQDILDFSRNSKYKALEWPAGYWPQTTAPPNDMAWDKSIQQFEADTRAMAKLIESPATDLFARIAHGSGQTILREAVLLADHSAYHLGQFVLVRRALGAWKET